MVYGIFVKSVCVVVVVVEEKEGVLLDLGHYLDLFGVSKEHALSVSRMSRAVI